MPPRGPTRFRSGARCRGADATSARNGTGAARSCRATSAPVSCWHTAPSRRPRSAQNAHRLCHHSTWPIPLASPATRQRLTASTLRNGLWSVNTVQVSQLNMVGGWHRKSHPHCPRPAKRDEPVTDRRCVWLQSRPARLALGLVGAAPPELIVRMFVGDPVLVRI